MPDNAPVPSPLPDAFAARLDALRPAMIAVADRQLDRTLAGKVSPSDVVQEAYLLAFLKAKQFRGKSDGQFFAWLSRIVKRRAHAVRTRFQAEKRDPTIELPLGAVPTPIAVDGRPERKSLSNREQEQLLAVLKELPVHYQYVIRGVYFDERTFVDLANELKRSADALRMTHRRALHYLEELLSKRT